jgi:hypothetical protein
MMAMQLRNFENALRNFVHLINSKDLRFQSKFYLNNKRYAVVSFVGNDGVLQKFFVLFKRDFYMTFSKEHPEIGGVGETINVDALKWCFGSQIDKVIFLYENGSIYWISPQEVAENGFKRLTMAENKEVYSFSIKHLKRYDT